MLRGLRGRIGGEAMAAEGAVGSFRQKMIGFDGGKERLGGVGAVGSFARWLRFDPRIQTNAHEGKMTCCANCRSSRVGGARGGGAEDER